MECQVSGTVEKPRLECTPPMAGCGFPQSLISCGIRTSEFQEIAKAPRSGILRKSFRTPKTLFQHALQLDQKGLGDLYHPWSAFGPVQHLT